MEEVRQRTLKDSNRDYLAWATILSVIIFCAAVRFHLIEVPLERDEGEYAYIGQLILKGIPPFGSVYSMKLPGIYMAYAVIMYIFGQTIFGIHLGLILLNSLTTVLVFLLGKKLFGSLTGVASGAAFAVLSLSGSALGITANSEHFVIFFAVLGIILLLKAEESWGMAAAFASGLFLGTGFLMKQHGVAFIVFAALYFPLADPFKKPFGLRARTKSLAAFIAGAVLPFGITCLIFKSLGLFDKFWFWTFDYSYRYVSAVSLTKGMSNFKNHTLPVLKASPVLWALSIAGLFLAAVDKEYKRRSMFLAGFFIFSILSIFPGLYFRKHYYILMFPAVALSFGVSIRSIRRLSKGYLKVVLPLLLASLAIVYPIYRERDMLFQLSPVKVSRKLYDINPFPESIEIARYIKENSREGDRITVIGSEPQIYFYSGRRAATGYIYVYPIVESNKYSRRMETEFLNDVDTAKPKFLVFVNCWKSWEIESGTEDTVIDWFNKYFPLGDYELTGVADILSMTRTEYIWGEEATRYEPASVSWVKIYKRRPEAVRYNGTGSGNRNPL